MGRPRNMVYLDTLNAEVTNMLRWVMAGEPQLRRITTFNAASNVHMIGVYEALGFVPVERSTSVELAV